MAQGQYYKGKMIRARLNDKTLFHATECGISITTNLESIATKDTNGNVQTPGNYEWSATMSALVADKATSNTTQHSFTDLIALQLAGTEIDFDFTTDETGDFVFTGKVFISQADITASTEGAASGSFSFTGNGDLVQAVVAA